MDHAKFFLKVSRFIAHEKIHRTLYESRHLEIGLDCPSCWCLGFDARGTN